MTKFLTVVQYLTYNNYEQSPSISIRIPQASQTSQACKQAGRLAYSCWKQGLPFLPPQLRQKIYQYNLIHRATCKLPPTDPPFCAPPHHSHLQQHQH